MIAQTYRGTAAGRSDTVVLQQGTNLPLWTEVLVLAPPDARRGSPQALLAAIRAAPRVTQDDVDALIDVIHSARSSAEWRGLFDKETRS